MVKIIGGVFVRKVAVKHHSYHREHRGDTLLYEYIINMCATIRPVINRLITRQRPFVVTYLGDNYYGYFDFNCNRQIYIKLYADQHRRNELAHISLIGRDNYPHITFIDPHNPATHYSIYYERLPQRNMGWNYIIGLLDTIHNVGILQRIPPVAIPYQFWTLKWRDINPALKDHFNNLLEPMRMLIQEISYNLPFNNFTVTGNRRQVIDAIEELIGIANAHAPTELHPGLPPSPRRRIIPSPSPSPSPPRRSRTSSESRAISTPLLSPLQFSSPLPARTSPARTPTSPVLTPISVRTPIPSVSPPVRRRKRRSSSSSPPAQRAQRARLSGGKTVKKQLKKYT